MAGSFSGSSSDLCRGVCVGSWVLSPLARLATFRIIAAAPGLRPARLGTGAPNHHPSISCSAEDLRFLLL